MVQSSISLSVVPQNSSVIANISYTGTQPSEFFIFYYPQGSSSIVSSISSLTPTNITISNLSNGTTYVFYVCISVNLYFWS
jgi:hypothetical protein